MSSKIRILIVDDHAMVRVGMAGLIATEEDMEVVAEAEDIHEAVDAFSVHRPDVTLMDVRMPGGSGLQALARIREISPSARVVILSTFDLEEPILAAHAAGACGYLIKSVKCDELLVAIRQVHAGGHCFPPALDAHIAARANTKPLTPREVEILDLIRRGLTNKEISRLLDISESTAKFHVKAIFAKLEVTDRAEAVAAAFERGFIQVD